MFDLLAISWKHYAFSIPLALLSVFLMLVILVQRGRGGGLTGALGGMGGQSAFGTKAGDLFTRITIAVAAVWILLCMLALKVLNDPNPVVPAPPPPRVAPVDPTKTGAPADTKAPAGTLNGAGTGAPSEPASTTPAPVTAPAPAAPPTATPAPTTPAPATTPPAGESKKSNP